MFVIKHISNLDPGTISTCADAPPSNAEDHSHNTYIYNHSAYVYVTSVYVYCHDCKAAATVVQ